MRSDTEQAPRLKPLPCTDPQAVESMRTIAEVVDAFRLPDKHGCTSMHYRAVCSVVEEEMPEVIGRLLATSHPYFWDVVRMADSLVEMPLECFDQVRRLVHFEYVDANGEESRI